MSEKNPLENIREDEKSKSSAEKTKIVHAVHKYSENKFLLIKWPITV